MFSCFVEQKKEKVFASFTGLHAYSLDKRLQAEINEKLDWALACLEKDDRIVWFVGVLKRHLLAGCDPDSLPPKDHKKRAQALKFFGGERIEADYRDLIERFIPCWPHYFSLAENYGVRNWKSCAFSQDEGRKQVPLSVNDLMERLAECENSIVGKRSQSLRRRRRLPFVG